MSFYLLLQEVSKKKRCTLWLSLSEDAQSKCNSLSYRNRKLTVATVSFGFLWLCIGYKMSLLTDSQWVLVQCSFSTIEMDRACLCAFIIDFCKGSFFNLIIYANLFLFLISDSHHTASYRHLVSVYPSRGNWLWARFAQNKLYGVPSFSFSVSSK